MPLSVQQIADELRTFTTFDWQRLQDVCGEDDFQALAEVARLGDRFGHFDEDESGDAMTDEEFEAMEEERDKLKKRVDELEAIVKATPWWEVFAFKNQPLIKIGGEVDPYMIRWAIVDGKGKGNNVYLHKFLRNDDDRALHDHPWDSVSILLSGKLREIDADNPEGRIIKAGEVRHRSAAYAHRLIVEETGFSLFITGPKLREWGFLCEEGWRHWTRFAAGEDSEIVGAGCGDYSEPITEATPYDAAIEAKRKALGRAAA